MLQINFWRWLRVVTIFVVCLAVFAAISVVGLIFYWDWNMRQNFAHDVGVSGGAKLEIRGQLVTDTFMASNCGTTSSYNLVWPDGKTEIVEKDVENSRAMEGDEFKQSDCQLAPAPTAQLRTIDGKRFLAVDGHFWRKLGNDDKWRRDYPDLERDEIIKLARDFGAADEGANGAYGEWEVPDGRYISPTPNYRVRADSKGNTLDLEIPITNSGEGWPPRLQFRLDKSGEWQFDRVASVKLSHGELNPFRRYQVDFVWIQTSNKNAPLPAQFDRVAAQFPIRDFPNWYIAKRETFALGKRVGQNFGPASHLVNWHWTKVTPRYRDSERTRLQWRMTNNWGDSLTASQIGQWMTPAKRVRSAGDGTVICFARVIRTQK